MILIADSGSTKTQWGLADENATSAVNEFQTSGINPFYQDKISIFHMLEKEFIWKINTPVRLFFYGAGCSGVDSKAIVYEPLNAFFKPATLSVESDLMAAAHSLCQHEAGLACIMGTGSNSCYYNGEEITKHVPSLGYILGDEGSGADIGRRLVADILKHQLPDTVAEHFFSTFHYTREEILEHVYKNPFPNRFLAGFATYVRENIGIPALRNLVKSGFNKFFTRNIRQYPEAGKHPVHFTGSIAWHFRDILTESATENGFRTGLITQSPMVGLIRFHI
jgi:N-acetylglucosamine kinase-like BadF-type ATPase